MKLISEQQQKDLEELYQMYYTYLCRYELGHSFVPHDKSKRTYQNAYPWYHLNDFRTNIEEEAHCFKVNQGY